MSEWPKGSLQLALASVTKDKPYIRRRAQFDGCSFWIDYSKDGPYKLRWRRGHQNGHYELRLDDVLALDWEVCE